MILKKAQEITYSNWIRIGDKTVRLEELSKEERVEIANRLTYRFLSALPNVKGVESNYKRPWMRKERRPGKAYAPSQNAVCNKQNTHV